MNDIKQKCLSLQITNVYFLKLSSKLLNLINMYFLLVHCLASHSGGKFFGNCFFVTNVMKYLKVNCSQRNHALDFSNFQTDSSESMHYDVRYEVILL